MCVQNARNVYTHPQHTILLYSGHNHDLLAIIRCRKLWPVTYPVSLFLLRGSEWVINFVYIDTTGVSRNWDKGCYTARAHTILGWATPTLAPLRILILTHKEQKLWKERWENGKGNWTEHGCSMETLTSDGWSISVLLSNISISYRFESSVSEILGSFCGDAVFMKYLRIPDIFRVLAKHD